MGNIPVLMYHALEDADHPAGAQDAGEQLYILQAEQFRQQMDYLYSKGYQTYLLEELQAMDAWPEKAVVLTFDDGHESNFTLALPILQQYGFKAHFFITTTWTGTPHFLTTDQIKALHGAGMGIGSHGVTHRFLTDLKHEDARFELSESRQRLSEITGSTIDSFSAPGGRISSDISSIACETGYMTLCSSEPSLFRQLPRSEYKKVLIPRFAVNNGICLTDLSAIIKNGGSLFIRMRYAFLFAAKTMLGNQNYQRIRKSLIHS